MMVVAGALCLTGCKTWTLSNPSNWLKGSIVESKFESPDRMVVIWAEDVVAVPGREPTRGFGGRISFYNAADKTIPVEGQLVVYGYDDSVKQTSAQRTPDRKFAFTADEFKKHFGDSQLGPSYSIWVPWDAAGGEQREVSLVPVFTSSQGKMVMGALTTNVLKGKSKDPKARPVNEIEVTKSTSIDPPVRPRTEFDRLADNSRALEQKYAQQTTYSQQLLDSVQQNQALAAQNELNQAAAAGNTRIRTTTINMTRSLTQQMQNAAVTESLIGGSTSPDASGAQATMESKDTTSEESVHTVSPSSSSATDLPAKPTSTKQTRATLPGGFTPPASLTNVSGYPPTFNPGAAKSVESTNR
ncbi:MAG: hypothetical protein ACKOU6_04450, partial [Planctomycetota bacterium]